MESQIYYAVCGLYLLLHVAFFDKPKCGVQVVSNPRDCSGILWQRDCGAWDMLGLFFFCFVFSNRVRSSPFLL